MKRLVLLLIITLLLTGCGKKTDVETQEGVKIYKSDAGNTYRLENLPYDMEYNGHPIPWVSCELFQTKSNYEYRPYIIVKIRIDNIDEETLHWFDKELRVSANVSNKKSESETQELSKICKIDDNGYRYYVFSQSLWQDSFKYDYGDSRFSFDFSIPQEKNPEKNIGKDFKMRYSYSTNAGSQVKDLSEIGDEFYLTILEAILNKY